MNIKQLQSYFEDWNGLRDNRARALQFDDCGAYGVFGDLRLHSAFQPIVSRLDGHTAAHEALLRARNARNVAVTPAAAFALPETHAAVVYLDRLCRMVHAVNFFHLGEQRGEPTSYAGPSLVSSWEASPIDNSSVMTSHGLAVELIR